MEEKKTILDVKHLRVDFTTDQGTVQAVRDVSFSVKEGEILGIVGESGSGKSVTMYSVMGLLAQNGSINEGEIVFNGESIARKDFPDNRSYEKKMREIRGNTMAMIFQDPMTSLDPTMTIGRQLTEGMRYHLHLSQADADKRAEELLEMVGIESPKERMKNYPHQLSGGMRQRVVIAIALSCNPDLLICDEPTTALDVTIQARILQLILNLQKKLGIAVIFITHNLGVVAKIADYVNVMYAGKVVETGKAEDIFFDPRHPYTWGLLSSMPDLTGDKKERLYTIPGNPPNLANEVKGDAFAVRNPYALNIDFEEEPPMFEINEHHQAATWLLHPDAPKVEMPQTLKKRIEQLRREEKRYAETEGAYGTDE